MRKSLIAVVLILILVISGCGSYSSEKGVNTQGLDTNYACTINVCGMWKNFEALDEATLWFREQFPNIEVVYNELGVYEEDLKNRMVSGKDIDIYMYDEYLPLDNSKSFLWTNAQDLSVLDLSVVNPCLLEFGYTDNKQAAVPIFNLAYGFMVNEDLLAKYKLEAPKNYYELMTCMDALKSKGMYPLLAPSESILCNNFMAQAYFDIGNADNSSELLEQLLNGVDSRGIIDNAITKTNLMYAGDYIHPDSYTIEDDYGDAILRFFEGDIPFVAFHTDRFSGTRKREAKSASYSSKPFKYCFVPAMGDDGYTCCYQQNKTVFMFVYKGVDEAKMPYVDAFLQFLISDTGSAVLSQTKNIPTANKSVGNRYFPYLGGLEDDQIYYAGMGKESDERIRLHMFIDSLANAYEPDIDADVCIQRALDNK